MQPDTPEPGPTVRMAGDVDRDAHDIPYEFGNRRARRAAKRRIAATNRAVRQDAVALKQK